MALNDTMETPTMNDLEKDLELSGLNSAQRDVVIYGEVRNLARDLDKLGGVVTRHNLEIYGDADVQETGLKSIVRTNEQYILQQRQMVKSLQTISKFLGLTNFAAWAALGAILWRSIVGGP